jgi:hypothetical protein
MNRQNLTALERRRRRREMATGRGNTRYNRRARMLRRKRIKQKRVWKQKMSRMKRGMMPTCR